MKKIFLFLLFSLLIVSANAMVFTDVGHKDTNKIEISKATPVLDLVATVNLEAIQINKAIDVGWQTNYRLNNYFNTQAFIIDVGNFNVQIYKDNTIVNNYLNLIYIGNPLKIFNTPKKPLPFP